MNKKQLPQPTALHNEKTELLITPHLNDEQLPNVLREALSIVPKGEMQDMLLLSILTNCAYALPAMRMWHGHPRHCYGPELMTMVLAPAASGKGIMNYGRELMHAIEYAYGAPIYLPANTSASAVIENLHMLRGRAVMMATEMDTLTQSIRSGYGGFSDVIRNIFEHETVSQARRQNDEFIEILQPHVSILLSGTYNQLSPLLRNRENGLMSRFACYVANRVQDFDDSVWDADDCNGIPAEKVLYERVSEEICKRYIWMIKARHECFFYLTDAQRKTIKRMFRSEYEVYSQEYGEDFCSTLKRMPVIMKRIGMILTGLRLDMSQPLPERVVCSDEDFEIMLLIGHKLLMHAATMYKMLPETKHVAPSEIGNNLQQKQFFQMLPTDFTKQDSIEQAKVLGINQRTMERWLDKFVQTSDIVHISHGRYRKNGSSKAPA